MKILRKVAAVVEEVVPPKAGISSSPSWPLTESASSEPAASLSVSGSGYPSRRAVRWTDDRPPGQGDQAAAYTVLKARSVSLTGLARVEPFWSTMVVASPDVSDRLPLVV